MGEIYYKGFDKDLKCRGYQYEIGREETEDEADLCEKGFHACEYPIDCFGYYPPADSRYCKVELKDLCDKQSSDSKVCGKRIRVVKEIALTEMIDAGVKFILKHCDEVEEKTIYQSAATNTGDWSAATNTGYQSAATVTGKDSVAIVTGYKSKAKAAIGCAIVIAERGEWNGEAYPLLAVKAAIVDGEIIKADTWYTVENGEFVEV